MPLHPACWSFVRTWEFRFFTWAYEQSFHSRPASGLLLFIPGIPALNTATRPATLFAPLLRRSACTKRSKQEKCTPDSASRAARDVPCASRQCRPLTTVHPCADARRSRSIAIALRVFPTLPAMLGAAKGVKIKSPEHRSRARLWLWRARCALPGPLRCGEAVEDKPEGWARWIAPSSPSAHGRAVGEPRSSLANSEGRSPESASPGCVSLGYFSLHKQREVTRSTEGRAKALVNQQSRTAAHESC